LIYIFYVIEIVIEELEGWAIEDARRRVRYHFEELHIVLAEQEKTAMAYVETETRGRLCALRQQQKDLTTTRSQVAGVCIQCESILDSEDWKLLSSSEKVKEVLATLEQQQQHYAQLGPDFLSPESSIPIIFSRVNINKLYKAYNSMASHNVLPFIFFLIFILINLLFHLYFVL